MNRAILITAWVAILAASIPGIVLREFFHLTPSEQLAVAIPGSVAAIGFGLTFVYAAIRPLREFFGLLLALIVVQWLVYTQLGGIPAIQGWRESSSFVEFMLAEQGLRLIVAFAIIALLLMLKRRLSAFFLAKGDVAAPVGPVRGLPTKPGEQWRQFGPKLAFFISLGTLVFLLISGPPSADFLVGLLPLIPVVLVVAALNAFSEEVTFKAAFLSVLERPAGRQQSLLLMAAFFGLGHYYGVPYGIVGVLMAGLLGWLLGKSMLETRGMFWAWFIHFCQDVLIFAFVAGGAIAFG